MFFFEVNIDPPPPSHPLIWHVSFKTNRVRSCFSSFLTSKTKKKSFPSEKKKVNLAMSFNVHFFLRGRERVYCIRKLFDFQIFVSQSMLLWEWFWSEVPSGASKLTGSDIIFLVLYNRFLNTIFVIAFKKKKKGESQSTLLMNVSFVRAGTKL